MSQIETGMPVAPVQRKKVKPARYTKYLYLLPAAVVVIAVIGYPVLRAIYISFFHYNPLSGKMTFAGIDNYLNIFGNKVFHRAIWNSIVWIFGAVSLQTLFGTIGAVLLNQNFRGRGVIRGLVLIPWATPSVLAAMMWMWILDGNYGMLNDLLMRLDLIQLPIPWLSQPSTAMASLILIDVWQGIPFFAVMLLAAMQTIPSDLIESSKLDGANAWQTFWRVMFPLFLPTLLITVTLRIVWTASYMDLMMVITQGGPAYRTLTIPLMAYYTAYSDLKFGMAASMAMVQAALLLVVVIFYLRLLAKQGVLDHE